MNVLALVPARGGSKGVPRKNIRNLCGHPLLAYSIAAARQCSRIDRVIVSTDSEAIAAVGREYGAEVPFLRPAEFATDASTDRELMIHAVEWLERPGAGSRFIAPARPTTPPRGPAVLHPATRP